ncbi:MAG: response regulator [Longimicrobiaceae bacterium]
MPGETVLLVDPDADVQATIGRLLVHHGYRVVGVRDAAAALEAAQGEAPDVVIVDPSPGRNLVAGHAVLRELGGLRGIPVIAVTADVVRLPVASLLAEGYAAAAAKPCSLAVVVRAVRRVLDARPAPPPAPLT